MIVDELIAVLGYDIRGQENLTRWQSSLDKAAAVAGRFASNVADAVGRASAAVAVTAKTALAGLGASVIATGAEFEQYRTQLETLEGSAEQAAKSMRWVSEFAAKNAQDVGKVADAYVQMRTFGLEPTTGALKSLMDTAVAAGKNADISGVVLAVGQAWTKGKLQQEEALQLIERGVPVWDLLSEKLGKTAAELQDLSSKGKLGRDTIQLLIDAMGEKNLGAMDRYANTWQGMLSRISGYWTQFQLLIAEGGFFDEAKRSLATFLDAIDTAFKDGTAVYYAKMLGDALTTMARQVGIAIERVVRHLRWLDEHRDVAERLYKTLAPWLAFLMLRAFPVATALAAVAFAVDDVLTYLQGGESIIGNFIAELQRLTGVSQGVAEALTATLGAALAAFVVSGGLKASAIAIGRSLLLGLFSWAGAVALVVEGLGRLFFGISLFDEGYRLGQTLVTGIVKAITEADLLKRLWNAPREALEGIFNPETPEQLQAKVDGQKATGDWLDRQFRDQFGDPSTWLWGLGARHGKADQQPTPGAPGTAAPAGQPGTAAPRVVVEGPNAPPVVAVEWPAADAITGTMRDLAAGLQGAAAAMRQQPQQGQAGPAGQPGAPGAPGLPTPAPAAAPAPAPQSAVPASALGDLSAAMNALGASAGGWASANREALTNLSGHADKTQPTPAIENVTNDNSVQNDNREYPVTINQNNANTVNVTQAAQAVPAIGAGIAAAGRSAISAMPARMQSGPAM